LLAKSTYKPSSGNLSVLDSEKEYIIPTDIIIIDSPIIKR
jgi:hypothetical protein